MNDATLKSLLRETKVILVVGLSPVVTRPSFGVTRYLIQAGYEIYGVRPASPKEILGRPCFENLQSIPPEIAGRIDMIDVFRNSSALPALINEIKAWSAELSNRPKFLWLQEGVTNPEAEREAEDLGMVVVADRCILKDHARLIQ